MTAREAHNLSLFNTYEESHHKTELGLLKKLAAPHARRYQHEYGFLNARYTIPPPAPPTLWTCTGLTQAVACVIH